MDRNNNLVEDKIRKLSDDDLIKMIEGNGNEYTEYALGIALNEVSIRGGLELLKNGVNNRNQANPPIKEDDLIRRKIGIIPVGSWVILVISSICFIILSFFVLRMKAVDLLLLNLDRDTGLNGFWLFSAIGIAILLPLSAYLIRKNFIRYKDYLTNKSSFSRFKRVMIFIIVFQIFIAFLIGFGFNTAMGNFILGHYNNSNYFWRTEGSYRLGSTEVLEQYCYETEIGFLDKMRLITKREVFISESNITFGPYTYIFKKHETAELILNQIREFLIALLLIVSIILLKHLNIAKDISKMEGNPKKIDPM